MPTEFESKLSSYADLIVKVGLNLKPGQRLVINAPVAAAEMVRLVVASAYRAGARFVEVLWNDEQVTLARYQYAPRDSFEEYSPWRPGAMEEYIRNGAALLSMYADTPGLLKDQDPELIGTAQRTASQKMHEVSRLVTRNATNWCVISMPIPGWASKVFPDLPAGQGVEKLWQSIFEVCRLDQPDPVDAWRRHVNNLIERADYLNKKQYSALVYRAPGTDLTVGMPANHRWLGGQTDSETGIRFIPNMPTEELFSLPHRARVNGTVCSTLPLNYGGNLIEGIRLTFQDGLVTDFDASKGKSLLGRLLDTDEGARRLGEVALVPASSPVAAAGLLFYNTLYDENAACHLALGEAYRECLSGAEDYTEEQVKEAGGNVSMVHEDFMIGSPEMDIDGLLADGSREPVMRKGEWAF